MGVSPLHLAAMNCVKGGLGAMGQMQLAQNAAHMLARRVFSDNQPMPDFQIGAALGHQGQYFPLSLGQLI